MNIIDHHSFGMIGSQQWDLQQPQLNDNFAKATRRIALLRPGKAEEFA